MARQRESIFAKRKAEELASKLQKIQEEMESRKTRIDVAMSQVQETDENDSDDPTEQGCLFNEYYDLI